MANALPLPRLARTEAEPLLDTVGNTPLIRLERIPREFPGVEIFAKAEYFNPGWQREGPRRAEHGAGRRALRQAEP